VTPRINSPPAGLAGPVEVREVRSRRDRDAFVRFPWRVLGQDPQWVPPLLLERKEFINPRRHPFYRHGAAIQYLAWRNGTVVGRIQASDDPQCNAIYGSKVGCFGMFECLRDVEAAKALLDTAAAWMRARGLTTIRGPIDYSLNYASGLLVEGFDTPPRVMMNHNPPYYAELLESWGLAKAKDLYSWWFVDPYNMIEKWRHRAERLAQRGGVTVRSFRLRDFKAEVLRCKEVYDVVFQKQWGFAKMTDAEFDHFAAELKQIAVPELVFLAEVEGKPVGFAMTLPDVNEAIGPLNGRLTKWGLPIGLFRLFRNLKRVKTARLLALGVLEAYRRRGITELLILRTLEYGKNVLGYTGAELGWTQEDNDLINRTVEAVGATRYKTYRIYERPLG
jgi:GNAT superfamily N-acetyltransferase